MAITKLGKRIILVGGIGVGVLGLIVLISYMRKQYNLLYNSCYAISGAVIKSFGISNVSFTLLVKLFNRSDISLNVTKQFYQIYINDMLVSKIEKNDTFEFPAQSTQVISLDVSFNPQDLLKAGLRNISALIADKSKLMIKTSGLVSANAGIFTARDLSIETTMSLAELLEPSQRDVDCEGFK